MPRRNNRDRRFDPKEYDSNSKDHLYDTPSTKSKPVRRRKGKFDKRIYKEESDG